MIPSDFIDQTRAENNSLTTFFYMLLGNFRPLFTPAATLADDQSKEANGSEWENGFSPLLGEWWGGEEGGINSQLIRCTDVVISL